MKQRPGRITLVSMALLAVAVAAGAFLVSTRRAPAGAEGAQGGPLLGRSAAPIDALLVNRQGVQLRFDRQPQGGWTLRGALEDDLDPQAIAALLTALESAVAGPLLPGTEPDDRRYEFNGPESLRLTAHRADGTSVDLALGTANPLNGYRYVSGAGRRFCFTVEPMIRERLMSLPDAVRARTLLPGVDPAGIDRITLEREGTPWTLARSEGRWWLQASGGAAAFGPLAERYHAQYDDRRRTDGDGLWLQASASAVEGLVHDVTDVIVRELAPADRTAELVAAWGLSPPWRRVTLAGPNVRPALAGAPGDDGAAPTLAFGPPLRPNAVPVLRRGNVLVADREATSALEQPVTALLDLTALPVRALDADRIAINFEGRPLLSGSRRGDAASGDGRAAWLTDEPAAGDVALGDAERHGLVRDLVVNLGRQPIGGVLPPRTGTSPLRPEGLVGVTLVFGTGPQARTLNWQVGRLWEPAGAATCALWTPQDGRLVAIGDDLLVSVRNAAALIAASPAAGAAKTP